MQKEKRPRVFASIMKDPINPADFLALRIPFACEDCSHYAPVARSCTFGFNAENHKRDQQLKSYLLGGRMAICRFLEID